MTLYVPANSGQVIHSITLSGDQEPMAVTYGLTLEADAIFGTQAVATELHDAFGDHLMLNLNSSYVLDRTEIRWQATQPSDVSDPVLYIATGARAGAQAGAPLPQNCAALVHKRTARAGRRGRGRMYIPGILEGNVGPTGAWTGTQQTDLQNALNLFLARFDVGPLLGHRMSLLHSYASTATPDPSFLAPDLITSLQIDPVIATQRRRLRR